MQATMQGALTTNRSGFAAAMPQSIRHGKQAVPLAPRVQTSMPPALHSNARVSRGVTCRAEGSDTIKMDGEVTEVLKGGKFNVQLDNGFLVQAYLCGRMRQANVRLVAGDRVGTELSVYDLTKGRIMERYKTTYEIERAQMMWGKKGQRRDLKKQSNFVGSKNVKSAQKK